MKFQGVFTGTLLVVATPALAGSTTVASATVTARIVQPLQVSKVSDLAFGTIVRATSTGTNVVTIDPSTGARKLSGSGDGMLAASDASRAAFTLTGAGGQRFSFSVPDTIVIASGANAITVALTTSGATGILSGGPGATGSATVGIGGSFSLDSAQAPGVYAAAFNATIDYD